MPTAYGGSAGSTVEMCILNEELSRAQLAVTRLTLKDGLFSV